MLDADDELLPGALTSLLEGIEGHPEVAVYSMSLVEAASGERHRSPRSFAIPLTRARRLFALTTAAWSLYPIQGNALMRTAWVRDSGGYPDTDDGEDWTLAVSQAFRGRVVLDRRPGLLYHAAPESSARKPWPTSRVLAGAKHVRARMRSDPGVPGWARVALPLVAVIQTLLIVAVRPVFLRARAMVAAITGRG